MNAQTLVNEIISLLPAQDGILVSPNAAADIPSAELFTAGLGVVAYVGHVEDGYPVEAGDDSRGQFNTLAEAVAFVRGYTVGLREAQAQTEATPVEGMFIHDSLSNEEGRFPVFEAVRFGIPWNGWATPVVTRAVVEQIVRYLDPEYLTVTMDGDTFVVTSAEHPDEPERWDPMGDGLYAPGDGWTWSRHDEWDPNGDMEFFHAKDAEKPSSDPA